MKLLRVLLVVSSFVLPAFMFPLQANLDSSVTTTPVSTLTTSAYILKDMVENGLDTHTIIEVSVGHYRAFNIGSFNAEIYLSETMFNGVELTGSLAPSFFCATSSVNSELFPEYIRNMIAVDTGGRFEYKAAFNSVGEANVLLQQRQDIPNRFSITRDEMESLVLTLIRNKTTINSAAVFSDGTMYISWQRNGCEAIMYYTKNKLTVGGFIFTGEDGLL